MLKKIALNALNFICFSAFCSVVLFVVSAWFSNGILLLSLTLFMFPIIYSRKNIARARNCAKVLNGASVVREKTENV